MVSDAVAAWPALHCWSFEWLRRRCSDALLLLNDRAPARRADALAGPGSQQRTLWMPLAAYAEYIQARRCLTGHVAEARHGAADLGVRSRACPTPWRALWRQPAVMQRPRARPSMPTAGRRSAMCPRWRPTVRTRRHSSRWTTRARCWARSSARSSHPRRRRSPGAPWPTA